MFSSIKKGAGVSLRVLDGTLAQVVPNGNLSTNGTGGQNRKMSGHEEKAEEKPRKKSKLPLIVILLVLLLAGGGGVYFFVFSGSDKEEEEVVEEKVFEYASLILEPFYVNLNEQTSFLKVVMHLEYNKTLAQEVELNHSNHGSSEDHGEEEGEDEGGGGSGGGGSPVAESPHIITAKLSAIRDAIILVLSSKKPKEVLSLEGKELLKDEILEAANEALALDEEIFVRVDFVEFLVQ